MSFKYAGTEYFKKRPSFLYFLNIQYLRKEMALLPTVLEIVAYALEEITIKHHVYLFNSCVNV